MNWDTEKSVFTFTANGNGPQHHTRIIIKKANIVDSMTILIDLDSNIDGFDWLFELEKIHFRTGNFEFKKAKFLIPDKEKGFDTYVKFFYIPENKLRRSKLR